MVNNKKIYFLHGESKRCNLCLEEKLNILKEKLRQLLAKQKIANNFGLPTQKYIPGKKPKQRKECILF